MTEGPGGPVWTRPPSSACQVRSRVSGEVCAEVHRRDTLEWLGPARCPPEEGE